MAQTKMFKYANGIIYAPLDIFSRFELRKNGRFIAKSQNWTIFIKYEIWI